MGEVTRLLDAIGGGEPHRAGELLSLVYDELRKLAAARLAREAPGQTLQATALVHEAYVRLVGEDDRQSWQNRGHFFAAAAEAMRRVLIEAARRKRARKRGGQLERVDFDPARMVAPQISNDLLAVDESLTRLEAVAPAQAAVVKLRYFAGLTVPETARALGIAPRTVDAYWSYARAWLLADLEGERE